MKTELIFNIDSAGATIFVMKIFSQSVESVWKCFADAKHLDHWWAPSPWKCETQKINFQDGGTWTYAMVGPDNERHYAGIEYQEINANRSISLSDYFTDENGIKNTEYPITNWLIGFTGVEEGTKLTVNLHFASAEDLNKILEMGFEEGLKTTLNQLENYMMTED